MKYTMLRRKFEFLVFLPFTVFLTLSFVLIHLPGNKSVSKQQELTEHDENSGAREAWELERLRDPKTGLIPRNARRNELAFAASLDRQNSSFRNIKDLLDSLKQF